MEHPSFIPLCHCNQPAVLKTAWTQANPGRRFFGCQHWHQSGGGGCDYFDWFDKAMPNRTKSILLELLEKVDKNEMENNRKTAKWTYVKLILLLVFVFYFGRWSASSLG
ncbi:uncharacterized protein LOC126681496 [Mercurialis annua]|uniref:uncharacterized protein LOC126681496 n=1 Tax=Mercurialis annua TaxID=3986 RepID=UPI00215E59B1|nr:uncharacterized protein LOC126681496 [Mercurialis annua]